MQSIYIRLRVNVCAIFLSSLIFMSCKEKSPKTIQSDIGQTHYSETNTAITKNPAPKSHLLSETTEPILSIENGGIFPELDAKNQKLAKVKEMGKRRDINAIPTLLDWMFLVQPTTSSSTGILGSHPCAAALIQIGEPAVEPIQNKILCAATENEQAVLFYTLVAIKGSNYGADWIMKAKKTGGIPLTDQRRNEYRKFALSLEVKPRK